MKNHIQLYKCSIIVCLVLVGYILQGQSSMALPPNPEPGKCYAKCAAEPIMDTSYISLKTYIGNDPKEQRYLTYSTIVQDPDRVVAENIDGERKELTDVEAKQEIAIVRKPKKVNPSNIKVREFEILKANGSGLGEWNEVLCNHQITTKVIADISTALNARNYDAGSSDKFDDKLRAALILFQKDNGLPVGGLDFKTLKALKVRY